MIRHKALEGHHYSYSYSFCAHEQAAGPLRVIETKVALVIRVLVVVVAVAAVVVEVVAVQEGGRQLSREKQWQENRTTKVP
jgi:hypothetical protein